ncbi:presenilin-associated rhomboid-like protein, mitochondrial [Parasteatoda tepidariorum]|uniref:rhomboid protease n=1 Tax=Parasteatoda tepidariorum TaxID=114398 RepID=A0A2L2YEK7_PARTP|nr:presenilins-associated rhomboid-like protein, mitochondrial [Parasteatoda tepidariorum]
MLSRFMHRRLCQMRPSNFVHVTKSFNRQTKTSKSLFKRNDIEVGEAESITSSFGVKSLIKPFLFTVSFSGCSFLAASIWQYEEMRKIAHHFMNKHSPTFESYVNIPAFKRSEIRRKIHFWWHSHTEGQKIAMGIAAANFCVFLMWRVPALYPFMRKYFCASPALGASCLPMVLSTFSHFSFFHFAANMYVLYSFSTTAVSYFGKEQFLAVYCSAGVISSFTSYVYKIASGRLVTSLGASGALMAILSSMCFRYPDIPLQIIFLPFFTFSAGHAIKAIMALDVVGLVAKWKLFDHAAHLGGALFGILYLTYGNEYIWGRREYIFKWYHSIREK